MSSDRPCAVHADAVAAVRCWSCARPMCRSCWTKRVGSDPWCEGCVVLLDAPTPAVLYVVGAVVAAGIAALAAFRLLDDRDHALIASGVAALVTAIAAYRIHRRAEALRADRTATDVPPGALLPGGSPPAVAGSAYRGHVRRMVRRVAPPISGVATALIVMMLLALVAAIVPLALRLPPWIEWEITLAAWWLVWSATFATLLYRGWRVAEDGHSLGAMWRRGRGFDLNLPSIDGCDPAGGCADVEGCIFAIGALVVMGLALVVGFLLVELVLPVVFVAAYALVVGGLRRVANDHHGCEGHAGKAVAWGAVWALIYTAPLAALVWLGHVWWR